MDVYARIPVETHRKPTTGETDLMPFGSGREHFLGRENLFEMINVLNGHTTQRRNPASLNIMPATEFLP